MRSLSRSRKQRIKEITSQISELSSELEQLLNLSDNEDSDFGSSPPPARVTRVPNNNYRRKSTSSRHSMNTERRDGKRVAAHRDQKGHEGKKGTITSSSKCYMWIRLDNEWTTIQKSRLNVTRID